MPDQTSDLVSLQEYVKDSSGVKVIQLQQEVDEAAERLGFLLDYATLPCTSTYTYHLTQVESGCTNHSALYT